MECGRSPLVSIARVSVGEARPIATMTGTRKQGRKVQLASKEIRVGTTVAPGSPDTDIVALRPGGGLGLTAKAHARKRSQLAREKESRVRGDFNFQRVLSTG
jgi:hypothetical protein